SRISHNPPDTFGSLEEYDQKAIQHMEALLKRYCRAKLVITTKIHCALPCLAMGVNVILIHPNLNDPRLQSVSKFLRVYSFDEILKTDSVPVSHVDQRKLQQSQKFITELITDGIKSHSNIVKTSSRTRYRL